MILIPDSVLFLFFRFLFCFVFVLFLFKVFFFFHIIGVIYGSKLFLTWK